MLALTGQAFAQQDIPSPTPKPMNEVEVPRPAPGRTPDATPRPKPEKSLEEQKAAAQNLRQEVAKVEVEAGDLRRQAITAAAAVQEKEQAIQLAEDNLDVLAARETVILDRLGDERTRLTETLAALQMLERQRPPAIAVNPDNATQAVRSAILLSDLVPRLRAEADDLSDQLGQLRSVRERILNERTALTNAAEALKSDQAKLESLMAKKAKRYAALSDAVAAQNAQINDLARRSKDLSGFIVDLGKQKSLFSDEPLQAALPQSHRPGDGLWASPGKAPRKFADSRGSMRLPVIGKIVEKFGVPNGVGGKTKGIKIAARPGAPVVMPYDGRVKYAGPLKVFGQVLIVEAGDDYLIVLAGLWHVDALVGQWLLAGEPVGQMAPASESGPRTLYIEFRKMREPFDPLPWLASVTQEG